MSDFGQKEIRRTVKAVIESELFCRSQGLGKLLEFLIEHDLAGKGEDLKETYIGWAFYKKPLTYDPKSDSVVRVNATRLRTRLRRFYQEHLDEPILIELPIGSYIPRYSRQSVYTSVAAPPIHEQFLNNQDAILPDWSDPPLLDDLIPQLNLATSLKVSKKDVQPLSWWRVTVFSAIALFLIGFTAETIRASRNVPPITPVSKEHWNVLRFSSLGGEEEFPSLSPKGDQVAFVWRGRFDTHPHIYIQNLHSSEPHRLTQGELEENRPAWSPDGTRIAFIQLLSDSQKEIDIASASGGKATKIVQLTGRSPWLCEIPRLSWSADARFIYTSASRTPQEPCGLVSVDSRDGTLRRLTRPPSGYVGDLEPAVSPDGSKVAFLRDVSNYGADIYISDSSGENARRVTFDNRDIMGFTWSSDGKRLVVSSRRENGLSRLWSISADGKATEPLTDGTTSASFPSSGAAGKKIAFTAYHISTSIHQIVDGRAKQIVAGLSGNSAPQLSPDGKTLVFRSDRTGSAELWLSDLNGQNTTRLTNFNGPMVNNPRWSPDGRQILFECRPKGKSDLCVIRPDGKGSVRLLSPRYTNQLYPSWSADGNSIYFSSNDSGRWEIYREAIGQSALQITHGGGMRALESPNGHWLYVSRGGDAGGIYRMKIIKERNTSSFGMPSAILASLESGMEAAWDITDRGIVYLARGNQATYVLCKKDRKPFSRIMARLNAAIPQGDTVLSVGPGDRSVFFVERDSSNGEIDLLIQAGQT